AAAATARGDRGPLRRADGAVEDAWREHRRPDGHGHAAVGRVHRGRGRLPRRSGGRGHAAGQPVLRIPRRAVRGLAEGRDAVGVPQGAVRRRADTGPGRRVRSGHPAALRRAGGRAPAQRAPAGAQGPGPQRDRRRLHAGAVRPVHCHRGCEGAGCQLPGRPRLRAALHLVQRLRALSPMSIAEHLRKTFPGTLKDKTRVAAVDGVGFEARDGEIPGLLGPNGAGKTTTLRMLYTLMKPESGRVLVEGKDVSADPEAARRALGVLPDARGVYKRLTARENIRYFGELHGMSPAAIDARTKVLAEALQMHDFLDRQTEGFSQGQRTKTAIARALVHDPRNVILDEPTNGLDVMTTRGLREFLRELRAEGRCVIFSSHIMQEVAALCDRIVVIAQGRVVADGSADALRAQTGHDNLEDAFVQPIGSEEGLHA